MKYPKLKQKNTIYYVLPWILQVFIWIPTRIFFKTFYSYKVFGLDNIKDLEMNKERQGGVIFAVNHSSEIDPILIPASLPFLSNLMPIFYTSREKNFYINSGWRQFFYGGLFFRIWGAHTVYTGRRNYNIALRHHIEILSQGKSLCIFPEGEKTIDGCISEGKPGVAFLAHRTNSVVIPVRIKGVFKLTQKKTIFGKIKIDVIFGKPLYNNDLFDDYHNITLDDYKKARGKIMDKIKNPEEKGRY